MDKPLLIKNARIIDPGNDSDFLGSLWVEDGLIQDIVMGESPGAPAQATQINAKGNLLCPGLIDMRVFTGEPGHEYRETLASASKAAAAGGITSFVNMPDTQPVIDDGALVDFIIRRAKNDCCVNVLPGAAISKDLKGHEINEFGLLKNAGAVCLTDGRNSIQSSALLRQAFTYAANFDLPIIHHTKDEGLAGEGVMNAGVFATTLGLKGIPKEAESVPLARDLILAAATNTRYHAAQISCQNSASLMEFAKQGSEYNSTKISAGISINNLTLNELDVGQYRSFFKLDPPLRSEDDRQAMITALNDGTIDSIHSGHDPQDVEVKRRPFAEAASGAIGLETLFSAAMRLVHSGDVPLMTIIRAMTLNPAKILGLPAGTLAKGAPADFIIADLDYPWVVAESAIKSRSRNTAFEQARFSGKVMATYVNGVKVFDHIGNNF